MKESKEKQSSFDQLMSDQEGNTFEIVPGMDAEEMKALFFDEEALVESPKTVYRLHSNNDRYYYIYDEKNDPIFLTSVTTMINFAMPTSPHLIKWIADMGHDESKAYAQDKAHYGTFMHKEIAELLITKKYDIGTMKAKLKAFIEEEKLPQTFINYEKDLTKDILAFAQFMIDYKVKPLAIEIVLTHPDGYAGAIDLVAKMTVQVPGFNKDIVYKSGPRKGEMKEIKVEKEIIGMVDFKSGKKGFFENHEIQLEGYRRMWKLAFPNIEVEKMFNWAPKDWRGSSPTYSFKDQTDAKSLHKFDHIVSIAQIESSRRDKKITVMEGVIDIENGLEANVSEITLFDAVKESRTKKDQPKSKK